MEPWKITFQVGMLIALIISITVLLEEPLLDDIEVEASNNIQKFVT